MIDNPPDAPAIACEDVRLGFGEGDILRGVSFRVKPRGTLMLLGESGTGKTILLKLIAGLLKPDAGKIQVMGRDVVAMSEPDLLDFRRQIGFVFQEGALFDSLSVAENVAYRLREENADPDEIDSRVRETLRFVEMEHAIDKLPGELSGGMRRRVSIARALITHPPVVLYDSPTAGLDPVTSQTIITLILRLRDVYGVTGIVTTHRLQDAFALANFRFAGDAQDPQTGRVVRVAENGRKAHPETNIAGELAPPTRFLFLREGAVYFEGDQHSVLEASDPYLKRFLVEV